MPTAPLPLSAAETENGDTPVAQECRAAYALGRIRDHALPCLRWLRWRRNPTEPLPLTQYLSHANHSGEMSEQQSTSGGHINSKLEEEPKSYFYLAYGSNLAAATFEGTRGCKPLSAMNVAVPSLRMTFDLPGIPYIEPCFANTALRDPTVPTSSSTTTSQTHALTEKSPLLSPTPPDYHKNHWTKPLVGVVYELTPSDYYHVIATEGGGASYQDITIECHPLLPSTDTVPMHPTTPPFLAHTLYAPPISDPPPEKPGNDKGGRFTRPDPDYAQASPRYLKVIRDGAAEHNLPREYQDYLAQIRPYTPTTQRQRLGLYIFTSIWSPLLLFLFATQGLFADDRGRSPDWLVEMLGALFGGMWKSYDLFFKGIFGDGERSIPDGGKGGDEDKNGEMRERRGKFVRRAEEMGFISEEKQSGLMV